MNGFRAAFAQLEARQTTKTWRSSAKALKPIMTETCRSPPVIRLARRAKVGKPAKRVGVRQAVENTKEVSMRNIAYQLLVGSILLFVLAPVTALAQTYDHIDVTVPFRFYVHNTVFPAGTYTVIQPSFIAPDLLLIRGVSNRSSAFVITEPSVKEVRSAKTTVDFAKIGKREVLDGIQVEGSRQTFQVLFDEPQPPLTASGAHRSSHSAEARQASG